MAANVCVFTGWVTGRRNGNESLDDEDINVHKQVARRLQIKLDNDPEYKRPFEWVDGDFSYIGGDYAYYYSVGYFEKLFNAILLSLLPNLEHFFINDRFSIGDYTSGNRNRYIDTRLAASEGSLNGRGGLGFPSLHTLVIRKLKPQSPMDLGLDGRHFLLQASPNLKRLVLENMPGYLDSSSDSVVEPQWQILPNLQEIYLHGFICDIRYNVPFLAITNLLQHCPQLRVFVFRPYPKVEDEFNWVYP